MPTFEVEIDGQAYEVDAPDEKAAAYAAAQMQPGTGAVTYGGTETPVTIGQERNISAAGGVRPDFPIGTAYNPRFETEDSGPAPHGTFIDRQGRTVAPPPEPISAAVERFGYMTANPVGAALGYGPQSRRMDAIQSGVTSGLMLGGKNEVGAGMEALPGLADGTFGDRFGQGLARRDDVDTGLREDYPLSYYGGGAAGTVAGGAIMPEVKGATMAIRAGKGMLYNAPIGATAGFLGTDGAIEDRTAGATGGAVLGGILGGLGGAIPRKGAGAPVSERILPSPPETAPRISRKAIGYVQRQTGLTPEQLAATQTEAPVMAAEAMGRRGQTALGALARREGGTGDALQGALSARAMDRPQRLLEGFEQATGVTPELARGNIDALVEAGRDEVAPLFEAVRANPNPITTPRLDAIASTPEGKSAVRQAYADILNDVDGPGPEALGLEVTGVGPDGAPQAVEIKAPTLETWDKVYKALGARVEYNPVTGRPVPDRASPGNANINKVRAALRKELEAVSPEWGHAMTRSSDYMSAQSAFEFGQNNLFNPRVTEAEFAKRLAAMSQGDQTAAKAGIANTAFNLVQTGRMKPSTLATPRVRAKLAAVLGDEGAETLIQLAKDEDAMRAFEQRYAPGAGSITSEITQAIKEQESSPLMRGIVDAGAATVTGGAEAGLVSALRSGVSAARDSWVARGMSPAVSDEAGRILMLPPMEAARVLANAPRKRPLVGPVVRQTLTRGGGRLGGQAMAQ